jgi:hypothetical protein
MLAVLEDAIGIFLRHRNGADPRGCRVFAETVEWIRSDEADAPFSFRSVCDVLGLEPTCLRRGLARCRRMGRGRDRE